MEKKSLSILIIDDEPDGLADSVAKISLYNRRELIRTASNASETVEALGGTAFDLIFIDMELQDTDGFAIAQTAAKLRPRAKLVFLTGHAEMGAESYDYEPLDFLVKPLDPVRLGRTFERFDRTRKSTGREQIALESGDGFILVSPSEVLYITREGRRSVVYLASGSRTLTSSLDELELIFSDHGLFRCHQSYLVALGHIKGIRKSDFGKTYLAQLDTGGEIPVSRHRVDALKERLSRDGTLFI